MLVLFLAKRVVITRNSASGDLQWRAIVTEYGRYVRVIEKKKGLAPCARQCQPRD